MYLLLLYDITSDRIRPKVANACEDYGLDRIQYSAFYGSLSRNHQEELMLRITDLLGKTPGRVQLIPVAQDDWDKRIEIGNQPDYAAMETESEIRHRPDDPF
ncbi:MAG: CRISPR-associated endonuclease Cas2 [Anaerolineae bacterium]|nr:CRISPR-associated endonuclease Cas2 [Anaerolineae bacterium]